MNNADDDLYSRICKHVDTMFHQRLK